MLPMQIGDTHAGEALEVIDGSYTDAAVGHVVDPDRNRCTPDAITRNRPVDRAREPVAKAPLFDVVRHPANLLICRKQTIDDSRDGDIPGRDRPVDERRVRAIAEGVAVLDHFLSIQGTCVTQPANDVPIGFLDMASNKIGHLVGELAGKPDRTDKRLDARRAHDAVVIFTEGRRLMHEARTAVGAHVRISHDNERTTR